jgi:hypothetical protein
MLIVISSPYAMKGELYKMYDRYFGKDDSDNLVWQAASTVMNPTIAQGVIDRAFADDPAAAATEWHAQFRSDLEDLFSREALAAVIVPGRHELLPAPGCIYTAFVDPSGGRNDSMTLAIAHKDAAGVAVLNLVREIHPPFNAEGAVAEVCSELRRFGLSAVLSDQYAGETDRSRSTSSNGNCQTWCSKRQNGRMNMRWTRRVEIIQTFGLPALALTVYSSMVLARRPWLFAIAAGAACAGTGAAVWWWRHRRHRRRS